MARRMSETASLRALDALIEDLTVDASGGNEQLSGFVAGARLVAARPAPPAHARQATPLRGSSSARPCRAALDCRNRGSALGLGCPGLAGSGGRVRSGS
jgi:hypothetical protein